jgi:hypothetical protein
MSVHACALSSRAQGRQQAVDDLLGGGDVHGRGVGVVRRLAEVDVVVGMHRRLGAHRPAQPLDGAVGDHLVGVHVRLRARAGLPHDQREVIVQLPLGDLLGRLDDGRADRRIEFAQRHVGLGGGALDDAEGPDDRQRLSLPSDLEVLQAALGLRAPVPIGGHFDGTEGVGFGARGGHDRLSAICKT